MSRPALARIHTGALVHNYRILERRAGRARIMAVVKADAYGHGLAIVAPVLHKAGCRLFAVTDAAEGAELRRILGDEADIVALSGIFDADDAACCVRHHLTPVLTERWQLDMLRQASFSGRVWLKVDTGMRRLGCENLSALAEACRRAGLGIAGVMSHLACADEPEHPLNRMQLKTFGKILASLPEPLPASLLNSAGLAIMPDAAMDIVRPGIALYGVEPVNDHPLGLQPVMQLTSRIMQVRSIRKGESVSYGATFIAPRDMRIAVAALGYADGLPRLLSNRGSALLLGDQPVRLPIAGRVCMDYCLLDVGDSTVHAGDEVEFWGNSLPASEVAAQAETIAYELFTGVGARVLRQPAEA